MSPPLCALCEARKSSTSASLTVSRASTSRSRSRWIVDLVADVLAVLAYGNALLREHLAELVGRELVVLRDAQDRALDLRVVDADAGFLRVLQQRALGDQPLEHLLVEHVGRRRRRRSAPSSGASTVRFCSLTSYCVSASSLTTATTRSSGTVRSVAGARGPAAIGRAAAPARSGAAAIAAGAHDGGERCGEQRHDAIDPETRSMR